MVDFAAARGGAAAERHRPRSVHHRAGRDRAGAAQRAIELLVAELAGNWSPRGRFVRQTQIAYVMVEAGLDAVASILEKLVSIRRAEPRGLGIGPARRPADVAPLSRARPARGRLGRP